VSTRKQRRRREKDFRHDVRVFEVDEEGNEVPISDLRTQAPGKPAARSADAKKAGGRRGGGGSSRAPREVSPPSWERALRRGGLMGGGMLLLFVFVLHGGSIEQRVSIGVLYAVAFIPLTYFVDRTAYRSYQRRLERASGSGTSAKKK
jgi:hypothetical protein